MKALIELSSSIPSFSIGPASFHPLRQAFPGLELVFCSGTHELEQQLAVADYLFVWHFKEAQYRDAPRLRAVFTPAAGHEWVEPDPDGKVAVVYGAFHGVLMSESLLAMMLHFNTHAADVADAQRNHQWLPGIAGERRLLRSQTVLLVGYGAIGRECARLLSPFGCRLLGTRRTPPAGYDEEAGVEFVRFDALAAILGECDHVVLLLPGGEQTRHLVDTRFFAAMKPGAFLYNLGRGSVIDELALIAALQSGTIGGAGLDVFAQEPLSVHSPLWDLPEVLVTPHCSACYREYGDLFVRELMQRLHEYGGEGAG